MHIWLSWESVLGKDHQPTHLSSVPELSLKKDRSPVCASTTPSVGRTRITAFKGGINEMTVWKVWDLLGVALKSVRSAYGLAVVTILILTSDSIQFMFLPSEWSFLMVFWMSCSPSAFGRTCYPHYRTALPSLGYLHNTAYTRLSAQHYLASTTYTALPSLGYLHSTA